MIKFVGTSKLFSNFYGLFLSFYVCNGLVKSLILILTQLTKNSNILTKSFLIINTSDIALVL